MKFKLAVISCAVVLGITGLGKAIHTKIEHEEQFGPTIIKLTTTELESHWTEGEYPKKAVIHYHLPIDSPLIGEDYIYAVKGSSNEFWDVSVLKKTEDGYILVEGDEEEEGFLIEDLEAFGFDGYLAPDEPNGKFIVQFDDYQGFDDFMEELTFKKPWKDAFLYMRDLEGRDNDEQNRE